MTKKSNLYLFTFLGIFFSLVIVGAAIAPFFLKTIRSSYLVMSMDVNQHQAKLVAQILSHVLTAGESESTVVAAFQSSISTTDKNRYFFCLVDDKSKIFLAHPFKQLVGKSAERYIVSFTAANQNLDQKKGFIGLEKKLQSGAILSTPNGGSEIVNSALVPNTHLRVFSHENINRLNKDIKMFQKEFLIVFIFLGFVLAFPASYSALRVSRRYEKEIEEEQAKSDKLLLNILPLSIAERLKAEERNIANRYEDVSVLFIDMVDFTPLSTKMSPEKLVEMLNQIFSHFDEISLKYGLEKIKTIGDAYMVVGGIPEPKKDHLNCCIKAGLEMMAYINSGYETGDSLQVRMGLHCGPVIAGVIGAYKFTYDLWGETVNIASRLESTSLPGCIHCSELVYERAKSNYKFIARGKTLLKGMGDVPTYFLEQAGDE